MSKLVTEHYSRGQLAGQGARRLRAVSRRGRRPLPRRIGAHAAARPSIRTTWSGCDDLRRPRRRRSQPLGLHAAPGAVSRDRRAAQRLLPAPAVRRVRRRARTARTSATFLDALVDAPAGRAASRYRADRGHLYHLQRAVDLSRAWGRTTTAIGGTRAPALIARKLMLLDFVLSEPHARVVRDRSRQGRAVHRALRRAARRPAAARRSRLTTSRTRTTTRYFGHKLPIALVGRSAAGRTSSTWPRTPAAAAVRAVPARPRPAAAARCRRGRSSWSHPRHVASTRLRESTFRRVRRRRPCASASDAAHDLERYFVDAPRRRAERVRARSRSRTSNRFRDARRASPSRAIDALFSAGWRRRRGARPRRPGTRCSACRRARGTSSCGRLPFTYQQFGALAGVAVRGRRLAHGATLAGPASAPTSARRPSAAVRRRIARCGRSRDGASRRSRRPASCVGQPDGHRRGGSDPPSAEAVPQRPCGVGPSGGVAPPSLACHQRISHVPAAMSSRAITRVTDKEDPMPLIKPRTNRVRTRAPHLPPAGTESRRARALRALHRRHAGLRAQSTDRHHAREGSRLRRVARRAADARRREPLAPSDAAASRRARTARHGVTSDRCAPWSSTASS